MEIAQQSETRRDFVPIFLFALTLFLSASLMFVLQPMFGKALLPLLGGASSVWNTCMVFYQSILFLGYLYAHVLCSRFSNQRQLLIHGTLLLLSISFLPVSIAESGSPPTDSNPTFWLLSILLMSIGLPFFILSTTSPLLQKWFSNIGHHTSRDPYYLSIASNTGSLIALLSYPLMLEPQIGLYDQRQLWSIGFLLLCFAITVCMMAFKNQTHAKTTESTAQSELINKPGIQLKLHWLVSAFVPSSLLLGTTNYISIDIASVPLLWVIPLALYLISFIVVFSKYSSRIHKGMIFIQPWVVTPFLIYYFSNQKLVYFSLELVLHLLIFFVSIMVCHGELAKKRPTTQYLTNYYLIMSFGGMLGGIFNNFIAPLIFDQIHEYSLMIIISLLLNPTNRQKRFYQPGKTHSKIIFSSYLLFFGAVFYFNFEQFANELLLGLIVIITVANYFIFHKNLLYLALYSTVIASCAAPLKKDDSQTVHQSRNFYGVLTIKKTQVPITATESVMAHELYSGFTEHGAQLLENNLQCTPVGYYSQHGPLGQLFHHYDQANKHWQIGIIGLGAGELAAYAKDTQNWRFYELNPTVVDIATNPQYFSYLRNCARHYSVRIGDARVALEQEKNRQFNLLVIDAFTSDSIPSHLMTREAIALYLSRLNADGIVAFHISNRHLELKSVLSDHAKKLGLTALIQEFKPGKNMPLVHKSDWVVLAKNEDIVQPLLASTSGVWEKLIHDPDIQAWTDDFTSIVSIWK